MVLDLFCIILACLTRLFKSDRFYNAIVRITIDRYLDCQRTTDYIENRTIDVLSDESAVKNIFIENGKGGE